MSNRYTVEKFSDEFGQEVWFVVDAETGDLIGDSTENLEVARYEAARLNRGEEL
jgi:hypothetical protein